MRFHSLLSFGLLAAFATGCTSAAAPGDDFIDFTSSGGFSGGGEGVELHIERTGRMVRTALPAPAETVALSASEMQTLQDEVAAARFPELEPDYSEPVADGLGWGVTVSLAGGVYEVGTDLMSTTPVELRRLVQHLRDLSGVTR